MDIEKYRQRRLQYAEQQPHYRNRCNSCRQPDFSCYCPWLVPFDPGMDFIILSHPIEIKRRRITTGRMAHLSLKNSEVIMGHDYSRNDRVNAILADSSRHCVLLYPGSTSLNLTRIAHRKLCSKDFRLTVFVVDGTWATARKTVHLSQNLKVLPRVCFSPRAPSVFRVRQQPNDQCHSTIEAIHQTIELLGPEHGYDVASRQHDHLLTAFEKMVARQLDLAHKGLG